MVTFTKLETLREKIAAWEVLYGETPVILAESHSWQDDEGNPCFQVDIEVEAVDCGWIETHIDGESCRLKPSEAGDIEITLTAQPKTQVA